MDLEGHRSSLFSSGGYQTSPSANLSILPGQSEPCSRRFRPGSEDDLPSKSTLSSDAGGSSFSSGSLPTSFNDDEPDTCSAAHVARALQQWNCPCECLADNDLRLRAQSLRERMQFMSQESRKQCVWFELQKLSPSRPAARWKYNLFGTNVCKQIFVRAWACGNGLVSKLQEAVLEGAPGPPGDARRKPSFPKTNLVPCTDVDQFFSIGVGRAWHNISRMPRSTETTTRQVASLVTAPCHWWGGGLGPSR